MPPASPLAPAASATRPRSEPSGLARGRALLPALCALLLLSGAAGLVYQVVWVRLLGLVFGVTIHAISTVLAAFMAGLAVGSLVGGRAADATRRPIRLYGGVEVAIGLTALLTPAAVDGLQALYRGLALAVDPTQAPLVAGTARAALAFSLLLVPTALMGATLPLVVRGARRAAGGPDGPVRGDSRAMGALYALNTTGAVVGCLLSGFVLVANAGITLTIAAAAACNLLAGLGGLALSRALERGSAPRQGAASRDTASQAATGRAAAVRDPRGRDGAGRDADRRDAAGGAGAPGPRRVENPLQAAPADARLARAAFWAFGISGAVSLAYEVVWSRVLAILFDSSIYGFVLMLATVLLGIALGSAAAAALVSWRPAPRLAGWTFGWLEVGIGVAAVGSLAAFGGIYDLLALLRDAGPGLAQRALRTELRLTAVLCVLTVLPAALLMGATFPVAARLWAAGADRLGARLGGVYAANVAGAIVGSLAAGFVLVPLVGAHASLLLLAATNVALGAWLLAAAGASGRGLATPTGVAGGGPRGRRLVPLAAAAAGLALIGWGAMQPPVHTLVFHQRFPDQALLWYREGLENTVSVGRDPDGVLRLYTNSRSQTSDSPDLVRYHRVMGHLAALLSPAPRRVLVVGLGGGATPGAIARHSGTRVELVELSEAVVAAAPFFRHANRDLLQLPNVSLTIDDGRNFLLRSRQPYDIVTADIVHPYDAGSTNLYSVEYFRLAARTLAPGGLMVQWVPFENAFTHQLIVRTFLEAFPSATLWLAGDLLVGSPSPLRVDVARLERSLADPAARASLAEVGFLKPEDVLTHFRADAAELRAYVGAGPILTDDRPLLEYFRSFDLPEGPADLDHFSRDQRKILAP